MDWELYFFNKYFLFVQKAKLILDKKLILLHQLCKIIFLKLTNLQILSISLYNNKFVSG